MGFMDTLQSEFGKAENGALTFEQFSEVLKGANIKLADLSGGEYVSRAKYNDDLSAKDLQITNLNGTISTRDTDLEALKKQLEDAGADQSKLATLTEQMATLQNKYDTEMQSYKSQLEKQAYEFAVKEFAGTKQFTSQAAKRDFISSMMNKSLSMENGKILGAEDFANAYFTENADAQVVTEPPKPNDDKPVPHFVEPTGTKSGGSEDKNPFQFHFTGIRKPEE